MYLNDFPLFPPFWGLFRKEFYFTLIDSLLLATTPSDLKTPSTPNTANTSSARVTASIPSTTNFPSTAILIFEYRQNMTLAGGTLELLRINR